MTKASPGKRKIVATQPYEVLSIDFSFAGIVSKDKSRREDIQGLNGETCWIVAQDVFSKIIMGKSFEEEQRRHMTPLAEVP